MELIQVVGAKVMEDNYIVRVERDARPTVNRLYGCNIPAYPFTFDTLEHELEELQEKNDGEMNSQYLIDIATEVGDTIYKTREQFKKYVAKNFPTLEPAKAQEVVNELMECYVSGVCGSDTDKWKAMGKETQSNFMSERGFDKLFILYRMNQLKEGHEVLAELMDNNIIFATCQAFSLTPDGRLYVSTTANKESFPCVEDTIMDITAEVFALMVDYKVIPSDEKSLGQWLNTYPKQWGGFEKAVHVLADNLARILFGYTENDAMYINVVRTATEVYLNGAQAVADDVLCSYSSFNNYGAQKNRTQNATDADF